MNPKEFREDLDTKPRKKQDRQTGAPREEPRCCSSPLSSLLPAFLLPLAFSTLYLLHSGEKLVWTRISLSQFPKGRGSLALLHSSACAQGGWVASGRGADRGPVILQVVRAARVPEKGGLPGGLLTRRLAQRRFQEDECLKKTIKI